MLNLEKKNDETVNSPKKTFDIFKIFPKDKEKDNTNKNSPSIADNNPKNINFSSPLTKKNLTNSEDNNTNKTDSGKDNKNNIYSPYVKRIDISGNKIYLIIKKII